MKKIKISARLALIFILCNSKAFSQPTTVINYNTSSLNSSLTCNVFNVSPSVSVGGLLHVPVAGGVAFGTIPNVTTKYLKLLARSGNPASNNYGMAYAISYPFTANFTYSIIVNAAKGYANLGASTNTDFPVVSLGILKSLPDPSITHATDCSVVDQNSWGGLAGTNSVGTFHEDHDGNYTAGSFVAPSGYNYLYVLATGSASPGIDVTALLNTITINKSPNLTLSPSSLNITCGNTTPQTFTVGNPNGVTGIQSYSWNLGGTNNGWLYNGSAAPATITTTTGSITLTPSCGYTQNSISVAATIGGVSYPANNGSTITNTTALLTINGNAGVCTGAGPGTYSIAGAPCDGSVTWSVTAANLVTLSCTNCSQTTLTPIAGANGTETLIASTNGGCGSNFKTITIGGAPAEPTVINSLPDVCPQYGFNTNPVPNTISYTWQFHLNPFSNNEEIFPNKSNNVKLNIDQGNGTYNVGVTAVNGCGSSPLFYKAIYITCAGGGSPHAIITSPNPSRGDFEVSTVPDGSQQTQSDASIMSIASSKPDKPMTQQKKIYQIKVLGQMGNLLKLFNYPSGVNSTHINLSSFANGIYILQVYDNTNWKSQQIVIMK